jgi:hypothetical protein
MVENMMEDIWMELIEGTVAVEGTAEVEVEGTARLLEPADQLVLSPLPLVCMRKLLTLPRKCTA